MPQLDFYNLNANRVYPLQDADHTLSGWPLPEWLILDCGFFLTGPLEPVKLVRVEVAYPVVVFTFATDSGLSFMFTATGEGTLYEDEFGGAQYGTGFVVIGEYREVLPDGEYLADADIPVEPARVQSADRAWVSQVNLASQLPSTPDSSAFCEGADYSEPQQYVVTGRDLIGTLQLKAGYNVTLRQQASDNSIEIGGEVGAGDGQPCGEITLPVSPAEFTPPIGTQLGGVSCAEVIQDINGVPPTADGELTLTGGTGVVISAYPDQHLVVVEFLTGADSPFCVYPPAASSSSSSSSSSSMVP